MNTPHLRLGARRVSRLNARRGSSEAFARRCEVYFIFDRRSIFRIWLRIRAKIVCIIFSFGLCMSRWTYQDICRKSRHSSLPAPWEGALGFIACTPSRHNNEILNTCRQQFLSCRCGTSRNATKRKLNLHRSYRKSESLLIEIRRRKLEFPITEIAQLIICWE